MPADFWSRCVKAGCAVVPVPTYSGYGPDGNTHAEQFIGLKFSAFDFGEDAVGPDYYVGLEVHQIGFERLYETPEEALRAHEEGARQRRNRLDEERSKRRQA